MQQQYQLQAADRGGGGDPYFRFVCDRACRAQ